MDNLRERRELYNGFGNALSQAFELVVTPLVFGFGGHLLDGALGTGPLFTVALAALCLVGMFLRYWYAYDARMRAHERAAPWGRGTAGS
ncbi:MAG TPA: AtpZ/AtpI family protein [Acidimicrobiales bacterium]|nr:AtpZ/AtpI family protein [Acidimicrobiales bacterium]